jgi:hypothetical protein
MLVVHVIVALLLVMPEHDTPLMTGAADVVNV